MRAPLLLVAAVLIAASPTRSALGWPCGHGFIYRVHLRECVVASSPMARAYAFAPNSIRQRGRQSRLAIGFPQPPQPPPAPPPTAPFPLPSLTGIEWGGSADDETRARLILRASLKKED